jgi:hypothetical protein
MLSDDHRAAKAANEAPVEEALSRAEPDSLRLQVGIAGQGRLSRRVHRVLQRVALLLVLLGARLVRYGLPPYRDGIAGE